MKITRDSLLHAESCALLCIVLALFLPLWLAGALSLLAGAAKELWDRHHGGVPSWKDLAYDFIGALIGLLIAMI